MDAAAAVWDTATSKFVLGGLSDQRDLETVSAMLGRYEHQQVSFQHGESGRRSTSRSAHLERVMDAGQVRALPKGTALWLTGSHAPMVVDLIPWWKRPWANTPKKNARRK